MTENIKQLRDLYKKYKKPFKVSTQTVTCALDNVINNNSESLRSNTTDKIKVSEIKNTTYVSDDSVDLSHYTNYEINDDFRNNLQTIIKWTSDLKFISSMFNNYLWKQIFDNNLDMPEINDTFFTKLFNTVVGKKNAPYQDIFNEFAQIVKIGQYIPWISNTSQIICHIKNEMTTCFKNNIILNFEKRVKSMIRWRLLNKIKNNCDKIPLKNIKEYLFCITNSIYKSLINEKLFDINTINEKYELILLSNDDLILLFNVDKTLFIDILSPNLNSRYIKKMRKAEKDIPEKYDFSTALKNNCEQCLKYLYKIQHEIQNIELTNEYNSAIEAINKISFLIYIQ